MYPLAAPLSTPQHASGRPPSLEGFFNERQVRSAPGSQVEVRRGRRMNVQGPVTGEGAWFLGWWRNSGSEKYQGGTTYRSFR